MILKRNADNKVKHVLWLLLRDRKRSKRRWNKQSFKRINKTRWLTRINRTKKWFRK